MLTVLGLIGAVWFAVQWVQYREQEACRREDFQAEMAEVRRCLERRGRI